MTALPDDSWVLSIQPQAAPLTADMYEALPEEICQAIEIVDGYVAYCEAPTPDHQTAARRLANLLERNARRAMSQGHECVEVNTDVDLRLHDVPLLNRRPDIVLYRCLDRERSEKLRSTHALLVVEIVSPGSETQDTIDKPAEYAKAGISYYWIVRLDRIGISTIERYQLDRATMLYKHVGTLFKDGESKSLTVHKPIDITIDWSELQFGS